MSKDDEITDITDLIVDDGIASILEKHIDETGDEISITIEIGFKKDTDKSKTLFFQMREFDVREFQKHDTDIINECIDMFKFENGKFKNEEDPEDDE